MSSALTSGSMAKNLACESIRFSSPLGTFHVPSGEERGETDVFAGYEKLDKVGSFKYLGAVVQWNQGSKPEVLSRIWRTTTALARLKIIWNDKHISLSSKIRLMRFLVVSVLLYAYETWTLTSDTQKKLPATEIWRFRKLLGIFAVRDTIRQAIGPYDDILLKHGKETRVEVVWACIKISRACQDNFKVQGESRRGRQKKRWENNLWLGRAEVLRRTKGI